MAQLVEYRLSSDIDGGDVPEYGRNYVAPTSSGAPKTKQRCERRLVKRDLSELQLSQQEIENYYAGDIFGQIVTFEPVSSVPEARQAEERAKPVGPVTPDTSKPREGRARESEA